MSYDTRTNRKTEMTAADFVISGELFEMAAGPVGKADAQIGYPCRFVELHRSNSLPTAHIRQNPHKGG